MSFTPKAKNNTLVLQDEYQECSSFTSDSESGFSNTEGGRQSLGGSNYRRKSGIGFEEDLSPAVRKVIEKHQQYKQHPIFLVFEKKMETEYCKFLYGEKVNLLAFGLYALVGMVFVLWVFTSKELIPKIASGVNALHFFIIAIVFVLPVMLKNVRLIELWCIYVHAMPVTFVGTIFSTASHQNSFPFLTNAVISTLGFLYIRLRAHVCMISFLLDSIFATIAALLCCIFITGRYEEIYTMLVHYYYINIVLFLFNYFVEKSSRSTFCTGQRLKEEEIVLKEENRRSKRLLYNIFPSCYINEIKTNVDPRIRFMRQHETGAVLLTDLANFTLFSMNNESKTIIEGLNLIISFYDHCVVELKLEKVKSVGDGYYAVTFGKNYNLRNIVIFGLCILKAQALPYHVIEEKTDLITIQSKTSISSEITDHSNDSSVKEKMIRRIKVKKKWDYSLRVGISCGPLFSSVYGNKTRNLNFDVFGKVVNETENLEQTCVKNHIQVSKEVYEKTKDDFKYTVTNTNVVSQEWKVRPFIEEKIDIITHDNAISPQKEEEEEKKKKVKKIEVKKKNDGLYYHISFADEKKVIKKVDEYLKYHDTIQALIPTEDRVDSVEDNEGIEKDLFRMESVNDKELIEKRRKKKKKKEKREKKRKEKEKKKSKKRGLSKLIKRGWNNLYNNFIYTPAGFIGLLGTFNSFSKEVGYIKYVSKKFKSHIFQTGAQLAFCFVVIVYYSTCFPIEVLYNGIHIYFVYVTIFVDLCLLTFYIFILLMKWEITLVNYFLSFVPTVLSYAMLFAMAFQAEYMPSLFLASSFSTIFWIDINFVYHIGIKVLLYILCIPAAALFILFRWNSFQEGEVTGLLMQYMLYFISCVLFLFFDFLRKLDYNKLMALQLKRNNIKEEQINNQNLVLSVLPLYILERAKKKNRKHKDVFDSLTGAIGFIKFENCENYFQEDFHRIFEFISKMFDEFDKIIRKADCVKIKVIRYELLFVCLSTEKESSKIDAAKKTINSLSTCLHFFMGQNIRKIAFKGAVAFGALSGGIVGSEKFLYDIFGHSVNLCSRLCMSSKKNRIQTTTSVVDLLKNVDVTFEKGVNLELKGGEKVDSYYVDY